MKPLMKNVIWVDKCLPIIEIAYPDSFEDENIKVYPFSDYDVAFSFLLKSKIKIDLVISGYATFLWAEVLHKPINQNQFCFYFYDKIFSKFPQLPFILFSSIPFTDESTELYSEKYKKFHLISKNGSQGIREMNKILFNK